MIARVVNQDKRSERVAGTLDGWKKSLRSLLCSFSRGRTASISLAQASGRQSMSHVMLNSDNSFHIAVHYILFKFHLSINATSVASLAHRPGIRPMEVSVSMSRLPYHSPWWRLELHGIRSPSEVDSWAGVARGRGLYVVIRQRLLMSACSVL